MRSAERSQDSITGVGDAERLAASVHNDRLNRHFSQSSVPSFRLNTHRLPS